MLIDERDEPRAIGPGFPGPHLPPPARAQGAPRLGLGQEPVEELIRCTEMEQRDRPRFAMDAARLHDAVVGVSTSFDLLHACHRLYRHEAKEGVKSLKNTKRASEGLCIHPSRGKKRAKSSRIKDFTLPSSCIRGLLPESRARASGHSRPSCCVCRVRPGASREHWVSMSARAIGGAGGCTMPRCPMRRSARW